MKLVHVTVQVQYAEDVGEILRRHELRSWTRHDRIAGRDLDGRHDGSQAFPGNMALFQAQVADDDVSAVLDDLEKFRTAKRVHHHIEALVLPVERRIGPEPAREATAETDWP